MSVKSEPDFDLSQFVPGQTLYRLDGGKYGPQRLLEGEVIDRNRGRCVLYFSGGMHLISERTTAWYATKEEAIAPALSKANADHLATCTALLEMLGKDGEK